MGPMRTCACVLVVALCIGVASGAMCPNGLREEGELVRQCVNVLMRLDARARVCMRARA
jgi:hypothetical protein